MNKRKCLNEVCPLNKNLICDNPLQNSEKFYCRSKDAIKPKPKQYKTNNTLFGCRKSEEFIPGERKAPLDAD